jgi:hypothetical protein
MWSDTEKCHDFWVSLTPSLKLVGLPVELLDLIIRLSNGSLNTRWTPVHPLHIQTVSIHTYSRSWWYHDSNRIKRASTHSSKLTSQWKRSDAKTRGRSIKKHVNKVPADAIQSEGPSFLLMIISLLLVKSQYHKNPSLLHWEPSYYSIMYYHFNYPVSSLH